MRNFSVVTLRMAASVYPRPTNEEKVAMHNLVQATDLVIVDLGETEYLPVEWIRFLAEMTAVAEEGVRRLFVVAANYYIRDAVDMIGRRHLRMVDSVDDIPAGG